MSAYFDKGRGRWVFEFNKTINGSRVRASKTLPEGWNRTKAQAFDKAESDRLYGIATGATKERDLIESAVALYVKHRCPELDNGDGVIKELARIHWAYAGRYLDELQEVASHYRDNAVVEKRDRKTGEIVSTKPPKPATIKNKLSYLRAACRYAQKFYGLGKGIAFDVDMPEVRNARKLYVDRGEMLSIARLCKNRYARAVVRIAFYSGMRVGELLDIGADSRIDGDGFLLINTKNGEDRVVPIHPRVNAMRNYLPIKYKKRWMQRLIRAAMDDAGFKSLTLHDLRHSAASAMVNNGVPLHTVGAVLGHKDSRSTARYSHLATKTLADAIRKIK